MKFIFGGVLILLDIILLVILFFWFTLIMPGCKIGNAVLCTSAIKENSKPEIIMWLVLLMLVPLYIFTDYIGNIAIMIFLLMWIIAQWFFTLRFIFFPNERKIMGYNKHFEDTHHFIKPSPKRLVPDTYHIVLFAMLIICFVAVTFRLIRSFVL